MNRITHIIRTRNSNYANLYRVFVTHNTMRFPYGGSVVIGFNYTTNTNGDVK